jgi:DNA polymerase-1
VHDELVFEIRADTVDSASDTIRRAMSEVASLSVPLVVDVGVGGNWDEAH